MPPSPPDAGTVVVGVDIGGTGTRFVAASASDNRTLARLTLPTPATGTPEQILAFLRGHIVDVTGGRRSAAIGIGASGPIDTRGVIRNPDTLPAFTGLPIVELLSQLTDGPVVIDNDAVCAALAEHRVGAAQNSTRSLHITLGTGVGVCLLNDDQPLRHHDGTHPEGGHIAVTTPTDPCYCGRAACWEQAASRQTLQRAAASTYDRAPTDRSAMTQLAADASSGDARATAVFDRYGRSIAEGLGTLLTVYGPEVVVLGGSAATHVDLFAQAIETALAELGGWIPSHRVVRTALDDYGGAIGGAQLATTALADTR